MIVLLLTIVFKHIFPLSIEIRWPQVTFGFNKRALVFNHPRQKQLNSTDLKLFLQRNRNYYVLSIIYSSIVLISISIKYIYIGVDCITWEEHFFYCSKSVAKLTEQVIFKINYKD